MAREADLRLLRGPSLRLVAGDEEGSPSPPSMHTGGTQQQMLGGLTSRVYSQPSSTHTPGGSWLDMDRRYETAPPAGDLPRLLLPRHLDRRAARQAHVGGRQERELRIPGHRCSALRQKGLYTLVAQGHDPEIVAMDFVGMFPILCGLLRTL